MSIESINPTTGEVLGILESVWIVELDSGGSGANRGASHSGETFRVHSRDSGRLERPGIGAIDRPSDAAGARLHQSSRHRPRPSWRTGRVCLRWGNALHVLRSGAVTSRSGAA